MVLPITMIAPSALAQDDGVYPVSRIDSVSKYVARRTSLGGASLQPSTEIGTSIGLTGGIWYSAGIGSDSDVQVDEINLYASYDIPLDLPVSLSVGGTYYFFPQFGSVFETEGGAGSYEINGSAS